MKKVWKGMWKNPEYRAMMLEKRKKQWKKKSTRENQRKGLLKYYETQTLGERRVRLEKATEVLLEKMSTASYKKLASARTTKQMNRQWADEEYKAKMFLVRKEQANRPEELRRKSRQAKKDWKNKDFRRKNMAIRQKVMYSNPEWIKKVTAAGFKKGSKPWNAGHTKKSHPALMKMSLALQGTIPDWGRYGKWYEGKCGKVWMRSTWEVAFAEYLDVENLAWKYEPKFFYVGKGHWVGETYRPDFYILAWKAYVEVKGYLSEMNKRKLAEFKRRYKNVKLMVLDRKKLLKMGVRIK